jgi:hypothetical protein
MFFGSSQAHVGILRSFLVPLNHTEYIDSSFHFSINSLTEGIEQ